MNNPQLDASFVRYSEAFYQSVVPLECKVKYSEWIRLTPDRQRIITEWIESQPKFAE